jgi:hypothetical protein
LEIQAERGYLIPAVNTDTTDYVSCANQLAHSIREWHPDANITVLTQDMLPFGDRGGFANDWQCFYASPYRQTIKLEADMIAAGPVDHWWTMLEKRDVVISQGCRTFYDGPAVSRYYRKTFDNNALPDVYNAITYWRLSNQAKEFFDLVRNIFENWEQWRTILKFGDKESTTDVVYAMAAQIIGPEKVTLPKGYGPTMVHMKQHMQHIKIIIHKSYANHKHNLKYRSYKNADDQHTQLNMERH